MVKSARFALAPLALLFAVPACSAESGESDKQRALASQRQQATDLYAQYIDETDRRYDRCVDELEATGTCTIPEPGTTRTLTIVVTGVTPTGWREIRQRMLAARRAIRQALRDAKDGMCEIVAPFAGLQHPYFYMGVSGQAGAFANVSGNVDVVYDLWNQTAGVFVGAAGGANLTVGAGVGAYAGYAFDLAPQKNRSLNDNWGGWGCSVSGSLGLEAIANVSLNGQVGINPEGDFVQVAGGLSAGIDFVSTLVDADIGVSVGKVGNWDAATELLGSRNWGMGRQTLTDGDGRKYVQFNGPVEMALSMIFEVPPPQGVVVATQVLAIAALKKTGLSIEQACPTEVANAPKPDLGPLADACSLAPGGENDVVAMVQEAVAAEPGEQTAAEVAEGPKTPCSGVQDDDYCGWEIGYENPKAKVVCRGGFIADTYDCGVRCFREFGYAYCEE